MKQYGTVEHAGRRYTEMGQEIRPQWHIRALPHVNERLKRIFTQVGQQDETGALVMTDTPETCKDVLWILSRWPMKLSERDHNVLLSRAAEYDEAQATVENILAGGSLSPDGHWPVIEPRDYQRIGSDIILTQKRIVLLDEVGLGKSLTALLTMRDYEALPMIVVCQSHLQEQWKNEITKFFPMVPVHIIKKSSVYNIAQAREMHGHSPHVLIISYAKLHGWASHLAGIVRTVVFDEVQELRRAESRKYKAAKQIADASAYVVGATASLVYNYGGEVHTIVQVVKPDALGTRAEFVQAWGRVGSNDKVIVSDPAALGSYLRDELIVVRRTRKEVGRELPETIRIEQIVEGDEDLFDKEMAEGGGLALAEKIVGGFGTKHELFTARGDFDAQLRRATGMAKAPYVAAFVDLLLESEEKVLVGLWHRDVYDVMLERLAHHNPAMYTGSENASRKTSNARRFKEDPECRVMFMSLRSGTGLNGLQDVCRVVAFGELDWAPPTHDQFIGRLRRDGMDEVDPVVAFYLNCSFGSDPLVLETLGVKRGQSNPIHDPDVALFEQIASNVGDRVKVLAEAALKRRQERRAA